MPMLWRSWQKQGSASRPQTACRLSQAAHHATSAMPPLLPTISRFAQEIGNVHAALDWAFAPSGDAALGVELTAGFVPVWMQLLSFMECSTRIEHALAHLPEFTCIPRLKAQLYVALGFALLNTTGSADRMKAALSIGLALGEELSDLELQLKAVWTLWSYNLNSGQYDAAKRSESDTWRSPFARETPPTRRSAAA